MNEMAGQELIVVVHHPERIADLATLSTLLFWEMSNVKMRPLISLLKNKFRYNSIEWRN